MANKTIEVCVRKRDLAADETRQQKRYWAKSKTDSAGQLLRVMASTLTQPMLLECRWSDEERSLYGGVELPMNLPPRPRPKSPGDIPIINMGEIAMTETPLLALQQPAIVESPVLPVGEGIVVDQTGAPIQGVWVSASNHGKGRSVRLGRVRTDSMGRFRLEAKDPVPFYLALDHRKYVYRHTQREEAFQPGAIGIEIVLETARQLEVSFADMSLAFGGHVEIQVHGEQGNHTARQKGPSMFRFERLPEGTYELVIQAERSRIELARFDKVEVYAGEGQPDSRLVNIDFAALAYSRWYTFEGPDGKPIEVEEVDMQVPGYPRARQSQDTNGTSRLFLVLPRDVPYVRFGVKGIGMAQVPMGDEDVVVRLQGGG